MPDRANELEGCSVVVIGAFNPAIFHPLWFARFNLLRPDEAEQAQIEIIHNDIAGFSLDWLGIQVTQERFLAHTADPTKRLPLRDLVTGVFAVLEHVPIFACGLNRDVHYRMSSKDDLRRVEDRLAPKADWGAVLSEPSLVSLKVQGRREGLPPEAAVRIRVEPSVKVEGGLFLGVNEHHEWPDGEKGKPGSAGRIARTVGAHWADFLTYSDRVATALFASLDRDPDDSHRT